MTAGPGLKSENRVVVVHPSKRTERRPSGRLPCCASLRPGLASATPQPTPPPSAASALTSRYAHLLLRRMLPSSELPFLLQPRQVTLFTAYFTVL